MATDILKRFALMIILCVAQALVLNRIHLFSVATPLLYVMLPLHFRPNHPRWSVLLWSFCMGLLVDVFSNTPGVAAASMTFVGMLQTYLLPAFLSREEEESIEPSLKSLGWLKFMSYAFILVFTHCLLFFTIETFSFYDIVTWAEAVGGSTAVTLFFIVAIEKIAHSS